MRMVTIPVCDFIDMALCIIILTENRDALDVLLDIWPKPEIWDIQVDPYFSEKDLVEYLIKRPLIDESVRDSIEDALQEFKEVLQENNY